MRRGLIAWALALSALVPVARGQAAASSLPTPALIERAVAAGRIDRATADRYLSLALTDPLRLPAEYRSPVPWEGTPWLLALRDRAAGGEPGPAVRRALASQEDTCSAFTGSAADDASPHFHMRYTVIGGGLSIDEYRTALDSSWDTEVGAFGWAAPPLVPGPKYLVVVAPLGPALFGFVTPTATVGNNPSTPWNEGDARASCMVLNSDFSTFPPSTALQVLQATAAHEFNHAIQFGYGALDGGPTSPDPVFLEGLTTWIEDEVFDGSDDNYRYLWPDFADDMGDYKGGRMFEPYEYWITWRGIAEPFGLGNAGGGEDVVQRFWELTSQGEASNQEAMDRALRSRGTTLADAYQAYAVAVRFNRPCGGGYARPHCLEEGPAYVARAGPPPVHGQIPAIPGSFQGAIPDNYSLNWVIVPAGPGPFRVVVHNLSGAGGMFRATVACDTGTGLRVKALPGSAGAGDSVSIKRFEAAGCLEIAVVVTNVAQTEANPSASAGRPYRVEVGPPPERSRITVRARVKPAVVVATGRLRPRHPGERVVVKLFEREARRWDRVATERPRLRAGGRRYRASFDRPEASRCKVVARFPGDDDHLPSRRARTFAC